MRLSPTQVVFMTTGSGSCPWWPKRLIALSHTAIRIDMRIRNRGTACAQRSRNTGPGECA